MATYLVFHDQCQPPGWADPASTERPRRPTRLDSVRRAATRRDELIREALPSRAAAARSEGPPRTGIAQALSPH